MGDAGGGDRMTEKKLIKVTGIIKIFINLI